MLDVANVVRAHVAVREKEQENKNIIKKKERVDSLARARVLQSLHLRGGRQSKANNSAPKVLSKSLRAIAKAK